MGKQIFISWSKERSLEFANCLRTLLESMPSFDENCSIIMSTDISEGMLWLDQLKSQIDSANTCVVCLTSENIGSEWINFEVGALSNKFGHKQIFPFFFDLNPAEISGPISLYQGAEANEKGVTRYLKFLGVLKEEETIPGHLWDAFESSLDEIRQKEFKYGFPDFQSLFDRRTFNERIVDCSDQNWNKRYGVIKQTLLQMELMESRVLNFSSPGVIALFQALKSQMLGYAMELDAGFIENRSFDIRSIDGKLDVDPGLLRRIDNRFDKINLFKSSLVKNENIPVLGDSIIYQYLDSIEKKNEIVFRYEEQIKKDEFNLLESKWKMLRGSAWDLERIIFYLLQEHQFESGSNEELVRTLVSTAESELGRVIVKQGGILPIHYATKSLLAAASEYGKGINEALRSSIISVAKDLADFISEDETRDIGGKINANVVKLTKLFSLKI